MVDHTLVQGLLPEGVLEADPSSSGAAKPEAADGAADDLLDALDADDAARCVDRDSSRGRPLMLG